jgi:ring-1,2-phenylacetyl-CoA epoxidase subunit PaaD
VVNSSPAQPATTQAVWELLEHIPDPEIPVVSIRELGILRDVRLRDGGGVEVVITPTYSGCPAIGQIEDDIKAALGAAGWAATVSTQLAPAWTTDWINQATRDKLKAYGIAPPQHSASGTALGGLSQASQVIQFATKSRAFYAQNSRPGGQFGLNIVPCPQCGSQNTTETSHFASTACKALYKCLDCLEPFDYFKPY